MPIVERIRKWIEDRNQGVMTVGVWILVAFCLVVFICYAVRCYYLLR